MGPYAISIDRVVAICRVLLERGYLRATEGNVSVRVPVRKAFAITPSSYDYGTMRPADICVLDYDLEPLQGELKASIEAGMHAAVYEQRPDVNVIVHTHQPYASALSLVRKPIPALFDEQVRFLGRSVEVVDYAPSGTSFLRRNVRDAVASGANAFILANHGVLVLGGDAQRAVHNMALLEKCSLDYLLALMSGEQVHRVPLPIREVVFAKLRADEKKLARQVTEAAAAPPPERRDGGAALTPAVAGAEGAGAGPAAEGGPAGEGEPARPGHAISRYPDVDAVYARLHALLRQPLRPVKREAMAEYLDYFETRCCRSKQLTDEAGQLIPGGVQHNLAFNYPVPASHREGRRRLPLGRGRQPIHRLPAGRRAHGAGQQLRPGAGQGHRAAAGAAAPSPGCFTSTSSSWRS